MNAPSPTERLRALCLRWRRGRCPRSARAALAVCITGYAETHPEAFAACVGTPRARGRARLHKLCADRAAACSYQVLTSDDALTRLLAGTIARAVIRGSL